MNKKKLLFNMSFLTLKPTVVVLLLSFIGLNKAFGKFPINNDAVKALSYRTYNIGKSLPSEKNHIYAKQLKDNFSPLGAANNLFVTLYKNITGTADYAQADQIKLLVNSSLASNGVGTNKLPNPSDNLAFIEGTKVLAIDGYKTITTKDTITISVDLLTTSLAYKLKVDATAFAVSGFVPMLLDRFTNTLTTLVADTALISFTPTVATNTFGKRFAIVFKATGLPVKQINLSAIKESNNVIVNWNTVDEVGVVNYTIQSSDNSTSFTDLSTISAKNVANASYTFVDANSNASFYRIKATDITGVVSYSKIMAVSGTTGARIIAFPNPLVGNVLHLSTNSLSTGKYNVVLHNTIGQRVFSGEIDGSVINHNLKIGSLTAGQYVLTMSKEGNVVYNTSLQVR